MKGLEKEAQYVVDDAKQLHELVDRVETLLARMKSVQLAKDDPEIMSSIEALDNDNLDLYSTVADVVERLQPYNKPHMEDIDIFDYAEEHGIPDLDAT